MTQKTFRIITLGCKVNQYESACLEERLKGMGWIQAWKDAKADLAVINTCIVTQRASYQSRQAIRKAIRENPKGVTAAVGCYGQVFPDELTGISGIGIIIGNPEKLNLPEILQDNPPKYGPWVISNNFTKDRALDYIPAGALSDRTRAFLKIQDGCDSFCSYCIVPFARGPLMSLEPSKVIDALFTFYEQGFKETVLTGIHLTRYGVDIGNGTCLKTLLVRIEDERLPMRIRLSSLEPHEIDRELIDIILNSERLCRHFHIPLQSGDDIILKSMNRHYSSRDFIRLINTIHDKMPLSAIGLDVMAGFPGEDEDAYNNTFSIINDLPVSYLHVFPFSPRKGTAAAGFPNQVNQKIIKERAKRLRDLGKEKREAFHRSCVGKEFSVITKGLHPIKKDMIEGISDNYLNIIFPSSKLSKNSLITVSVTETGEMGVIGKPVGHMP